MDVTHSEVARVEKSYTATLDRAAILDLLKLAGQIPTHFLSVSQISVQITVPAKPDKSAIYGQQLLFLGEENVTMCVKWTEVETSDETFHDDTITEDV